MRFFYLGLLFISILSFQSSGTPPPPSSHYKIERTESITISSKTLGRQYDLFIKLPRGYDRAANADKRYPVLYLNDAPHTFKVALGVTHFPKMDKAIVVALGFAHGENGQFSRVRDLTPVEDKSWVKYQTGGATAYLDFIKQEVIPYVEKNYRADPNNRILSGHSLGGSFGAWVLLTQPNLFSAYILSSPSFWYKNDWIMNLQKQHAKANRALAAKVFIATGSLETIEHGLRNDMVAGHNQFVSQLKASGYRELKLAGEVVVGTDHYSTFPVALSKGLMFLFDESVGGK